MWGNRSVSDADAVDAFPDVANAPPDARRLIRDRRYCRVLFNENDLPFDEVSCRCAWKALEHEMAFVPCGQIFLINDPVGDPSASTHAGDLIPVESLYIDRHCVTNADFAKFVQADGYSQAELWPTDILSNVLQFLDSTGCAGPKFWSDGNPPPEKLDHPVVGICWYEANAYATWAGKQLPSSEQWQRAGTWAKGTAGYGTESRYPWGNAFDPTKANTWASRIGDTVPVSDFSAGNTPNSVRQLVGNVWEWVDAQFCPHSADGASITLDESMAEIRGAAFDTYFHSQATCQFRTGQPLLRRAANIGFRCCISGSVLPTPDDFQDSENPIDS
jgi:iron(II)-dependent oxidoreductase